MAVKLRYERRKRAVYRKSIEKFNAGSAQFRLKFEMVDAIDEQEVDGYSSSDIHVVQLRHRLNSVFTT